MHIIVDLSRCEKRRLRILIQRERHAAVCTHMLTGQSIYDSSMNGLDGFLGSTPSVDAEEPPVVAWLRLRIAPSGGVDGQR